MFKKLLPALLVLVVGIQPVCAAIPSETGTASEEAEFEKVLKKALVDPATPFGFSVHCRNEQGSRAALLYPSGIAVWGGNLQISIGNELRLALLNDLLSSGFSSFAPRYGGKNDSGRSGGPLRVSCQVETTIDGVRKNSVQLVDGEQSQALTGLAASLLDRLEPLASGGEGADSLEEGLRKIGEGALAPETLVVRLVQMPEKGSDKDGDIVRIDSAQWSWRAYRPGKAGVAAKWSSLPSDFASEFANVAIAAQFWTLPVNIYGTAHSEIEVQVLNHRKTVISRTFTRIEPGSMTAERGRYDAVAATVRSLRP